MVCNKPEMVQHISPSLKPIPSLCGDGLLIAHTRRGSVDSLFNTDVLQWQNFPCRSSVDYAQAMASERRGAAKPKNFIRENIRRLRETQAANTRRTPSVRGSHLRDTGQDLRANARMNLINQYFAGMPAKSEKSVIGSCGDPKTESRLVEHRDAGVETDICKPQLLTSSVRPTSSPGEVTSDETQTMAKEHEQALKSAVGSNQSACNEKPTGVSALPLSSRRIVRAPSASRLKTPEHPQKSPTFLRAHEKTALMDDVLLSLSAVPIKPIPKVPRPEKLTVPRANSARDVHLIRRSVNFIRANANAMSYSPTRRAVSHESLVLSQGRDSYSAANRRLPLGKVPAYIVRRKREAELAKQEQQSQTENAVPEGCRLMPEEERLDTLKHLQVALAEVVEELGRLPIRMDTVRVRRHRSDLESKLTELESTISIFKKPRVYVWLD